jgi:hypothetical protein
VFLLCTLSEPVLAIPVITKGIQTQQVDFLTGLAQSHFFVVYQVNLGEATVAVMTFRKIVEKVVDVRKVVEKMAVAVEQTEQQMPQGKG